MSNIIRNVAAASGLLTWALLLGACSPSNPISSDAGLSRWNHPGTSTHEVEFASRVASTDPATRTLTFTGNSEVVVAAANAEIVRKDSGVEMPIAFSEIAVGDSVEIRGRRQADGSVLADRIRVRSNDLADMEFESVIVEINLDSSWFTVSARSERILVNEKTRIFGRAEARSADAAHDDDGDNSGPGRAGGDTTLTLADLSVGDSVEVHALKVDAATLLATIVELEDELDDADPGEVQFKDTIASLDVAARTVTFSREPWIGQVALSAELRDLNGNAITLDAFSVSQLVEVKGFVAEGDILTVVRMRMENSL